ncbi:MAG: acyl-ACP thioesterase domain-containing protein [Cloacibacterium sp.]|uniref:acyl-CoA thioesterase n=1 Tax=Cloacibacterium sp. TaxID=1913682 RepID=UPI003C77A225
MKLVHIKEIVVSDEHLDQNNHVNNVQYVHWVEEMAKEHWDILKNSTPYSDEFWVLSDHHIQYKKQVFKGEVLTLKTYPEKPEGIRQPRKVEFYRGEELVVDSRTLWILMDSQNLKIRRVPEDWLEKI